jgi:hypothetical protein
MAGVAQWLDGTVTTNITSFAAAASAVPGVAGTYTVGFCVENFGPSTAVNAPDWLNGWVHVTN